MLKVALLWLLALGAVLPVTLRAADEADWKPESEESALRFLEESRRAVGEMCRFDVECLRSLIDNAFGTECRSCLTIYSEESVGYRIEIRPVKKAWLSTRHTEDGKTYVVSTERPETWVLAEGMLTVLVEDDRTYVTGKFTREDLEGWIDRPQLYIPPWFDPTIESSRLRSLYRVERARSTRDDFFIELVLRKPPAPPKQHGFWNWCSDDQRLEARHQLWIDRKTHLPTRWWMKQPGSEQETTCIYTRFDVDPPPRELKVSLTGYRELRSQVPLEKFQSTAPQPPTKPGALEVTARVLWWLLF